MSRRFDPLADLGDKHIERAQALASAESERLCGLCPHVLYSLVLDLAAQLAIDGCPSRELATDVLMTMELATVEGSA